MKSVPHIILATLFAGGTALAQDTVDFDEHDRDGDGYLSQEEWQAVEDVAVDFETADIDRDGRLDQAEVMEAEQRAVALTGSEDSGALAEEQRVLHDEEGDIEYIQGDAEVAQQEDADEDAEFASASVESEADEDADFASASAEDDAMESDDAADFAAAGAEDNAMAEAGADVSVSEEEGADEQAVAENVAEPESDIDYVSGDDPSMQDESVQQADAQDARSDFDSGGEGLQAFQDADANNDDRLDESEARLAGHEYVAIYFDELDVDGDGYLDESEWDQSRDGMHPRNVSAEDEDGMNFERAGYEGDDEEDFEQTGFDDMDEEDEALETEEENDFSA